MLGMLGVGSGILSSLAVVGFPAEVLTQFAGKQKAQTRLFSHHFKLAAGTDCITTPQQQQ
jgi:hypothetical protein